MFFVWAVILLSHIQFRNSLKPEVLVSLPMKLAFFPYANWLGLAALLGITASTFYVDGLRYAFPGFFPFLLIVSVVYWRSARRTRLDP